ncbi:hypothetical protein [Beijerinckia mobilis]|nr:hypothetical protein [Beijerinckia mobilis]
MPDVIATSFPGHHGLSREAIATNGVTLHDNDFGERAHSYPGS